MPSLLDAVEGTNECIDELKKAAGYQQDKADARIEPRPVGNISGCLSRRLRLRLLRLLRPCSPIFIPS